MKFGIRLHLAGLSPSDTVPVTEISGVDRRRSTVHRWVQNADLQPTDGADPNHVAIDETVIRLDDERYWLYAAVDSDTNHLLRVRLYPTGTTAITPMFLSELPEKHRVDDEISPVDGAPWLQAACHRHGLRFQRVTHRNRSALERVFRGVKRRNNQFSISQTPSNRVPPKIGYERLPSHGTGLSKHHPRRPIPTHAAIRLFRSVTRACGER
jgi:transposase-like protein